MKRFILDASVTLAWFLDNPLPAYASLVRRKLASDWRAVVPALWHLEVANVFVSAERRRMLPSADLAACVATLEQLLSKAIETDTRLIGIAAALSTARAYQLSAYDAVYLELAIKQHLPLATLDEGLRVAARHAGVELLQ